MVGPIWGNPQSKVNIQENLINNSNIFNMIPEQVLIIIIIFIILYIAYKINKYFKNYIHKYRNNTTV